MRNFIIVAGGCALLAAGPASAAKPVAVATPGQVQQLMSCRAIAAADQRLACFDRESAAMNNAIASKDLVFVDKEKVAELERAQSASEVSRILGLVDERTTTA